MHIFKLNARIRAYGLLSQPFLLRRASYIFCEFDKKKRSLLAFTSKIKQLKKDLKGDCQVVGSLLYAHYPTYFIL